MDHGGEGSRAGHVSPYLPIGTLIGAYKIESFIDRGGMAFVYLATDERLGRRVAMKVLSPDLAAGNDFRERFLRESRFAASIDHPNIVPIYEAGEADGLLYMTMRYVEGMNLSKLLATNGRLDPGHALAILAPIADALDTAHEAGLVHRDVKPANILLTTTSGRGRGPHEHVYLSDFGVTKRTSAFTKLTATGHLIGTMAYTSPEQIRGERLDSRSDLYAFGCVTYECLTGVPPFVRDDQAALLWAHLSESPKPISEFNPELRAGDAVLARALAKEPRDRYQTCELFISTLSAALGSHQSSALGSLRSEDTAAPGGDPTSRIDPPTYAGPRTIAIGPTGSRQPPPPPPPEMNESRGFSGSPPGIPFPAPTAKRGRRFAATAVAVVAMLILVGGVFLISRRTQDLPASNNVSGGSSSVSVAGTTSNPVSSGVPTTGSTPTTRSAVTPTSASSLMDMHSMHNMPGGSSLIKLTPPSSPTGTAPVATSQVSTAQASTRSAPPLTAIAFPTPTGKAIQLHGKPGFVALTPDGLNAYVADTSQNKVAVIGTQDDQFHGYITIAEGIPQFIAFSPDGQTLYVSVSTADLSKDVVAVLDARSATEIGHVDVDKAPFGLAVSPDGRFLLVPSHNTGVIDVVDVAQRSVVRQIRVAPNPHWVVFDADGKRVYVANHDSNLVTVLDARSYKTIKEIPVGTSPHSLAVSPDGAHVSVVCYDSSDVYTIDAATLRVIKAAVPVGVGPRDVVYSPDGRYLYVANEDGDSISVVNTKTFQPGGTVPTSSPIAIAVVPDGHKAYVTNSDAGTVTILKTA